MEESYLPEYRQYEAEIFIQGKLSIYLWLMKILGIYLWPMKILAHDPSSISRYSECTKTTSFSILGFFRPGVKLGFDFPGVLLNQKHQTWSINYDFDEDRNPMLGSLKNSSFVKITNFL